MKKLYFILLGLFFLTNTNAQQNCKGIKGYAYFISSIPGNLQVDENGKSLPIRINKERFIYITTCCKTIPTINKVLYGRTIVKTDLYPSSEISFNAIKNSDQKNIFLKQGKGTYLWKIAVIENAGKPISDKNNIITITGKIEKKTFFIVIKEETQLQGHDTY